MLDENISNQLLDALHQKDWCLVWQINKASDVDILIFYPYQSHCIEALGHPNDSFQRELLKLLGKQVIDDELKGILWDRCLAIWLNTKKISSVRIKALEILIPLAVQYPELHHEWLSVNTQAHIDHLSPGIRKSSLKLLQNLPPISNINH